MSCIYKMQPFQWCLMEIVAFYYHCSVHKVSYFYLEFMFPTYTSILSPIKLENPNYCVSTIKLNIGSQGFMLAGSATQAWTLWLSLSCPTRASRMFSTATSSLT